MKRFKFRLDAVLTLRSLERQKAMEEYGAALRFLHLTKEQWTQIVGERDAFVNELLSKRSKRFSVSDHENYIRNQRRLEGLVNSAMERVRQAEEATEASRRKLMDAKRKHDLLEKLKEKAKLDYERELMREEEKIMDDFVNAGKYRDGKEAVNELP